jgi:hypothetical protein
MRSFLVRVVVGLALGLCLASLAAAQQQYDSRVEKKSLKARQKQERVALKVEERNQRNIWKSQPVSKVVRTEMKQQMRREKRKLKERQRDEREDYKNRQQLLKGMQQARSQ